MQALVVCMRRDRDVHTPHDLALALGLFDDGSRVPTAAQQDGAVLAVVGLVCAAVPELRPLAVEAALFSELEFGSSVVEKVDRRAV